MKEIKIGTFYGNDLIIKVDPIYDGFDLAEKFGDWLAEEKENAVREYKEAQLLKEIKKPRFFWFLK